MQKLTFALAYLSVGISFRKLQYLCYLRFSTLSKICREVRVLISELRVDFVTMPFLKEDAAQAEADFFKSTGLPMCIGVMDGSHVEIDKPRGVYGSSTMFFRNKNNKWSIVLFIVVGADGRIIYYDVDHGGSTPDSVVYDESSLKSDMEAGYGHGGLIFADLAWTQNQCVVSKFRAGQMNGASSGESKNMLSFNAKFSGQRAIVENVFSDLKQRFKIMRSGFNGYTLEAIKELIVSCIVIYTLDAISNTNPRKVVATKEEREAYEQEMQDLHIIRGSSDPRGELYKFHKLKK